MDHAQTKGVAAEFWDREAVSPTHNSWMAPPIVREYINEAISGLPDAWPMDWFLQWLGVRRFGNALSVGCGTGALERDLIRRGICQQVDAFDGSERSIEIARDLARQEGFEDRIHYTIGDFNEPQLPRRRYDAVFFHQSAHHVAKLEKLFKAVLRALKTDGIAYFDEYIGPSRFEWDEERIKPHRAAFVRQVAPELRLVDPLPLPIQGEDPSEALRSSEIVSQLEHGFRIVERRDYFGSLLSVLYPFIEWGRAPKSLLRSLLDEERRLLDGGIESYHAILIAQPKRGVARAFAIARYFIAPKLRRIRWEIAKRFWPERNF